MQQTRKRLTSPLAVWEAASAVARVLDLAISEAAEAVESYLSLMEIDMVALPLTRLDSRLMLSIASARAGTRRG